MIRLGMLLPLVIAILACTKQPETEPCEEMPGAYQVSIYDSPKNDAATFFVRNYKACKKRSLKRNANALFNVGVSVLHGLGTTKDASKAFLWFKGAADQGNKNAQRILADMFTDGVGVPRDPGIGRKYLLVSGYPPQR